MITCPHCGLDFERRQNLTAMDIEIGEMIADSLTNPEIAAKFGIARTSVKVHVAKLLRYHNVRSRVGIAIVYHNKRADAKRAKNSGSADSGQK